MATDSAADILHNPLSRGLNLRFFKDNPTYMPLVLKGNTEAIVSSRPSAKIRRHRSMIGATLVQLGKVVWLEISVPIFAIILFSVVRLAAWNLKGARVTPAILVLAHYGADR